ncbi:hypothetical protein A6R68_17624, partial [Neotoma lepida]
TTLGVSKAVVHINKTIASALGSKKLNVVQQEKIDKPMVKMDGTEKKSKFGTNAILDSIPDCLKSCCCGKRGCPCTFTSLIWLVFLNFQCDQLWFSCWQQAGHARVHDPASEVSTFWEAIHIGAEVYYHLKNVIKKKYRMNTTNVSDEDRFVPNILENQEPLELLNATIEKAGYTDQVFISMDLAASEFRRSGKYDLNFKSPVTPTVVSIEDPFDQNYWEVQQKCTANAAIQEVGNDLT